MSEPSRSAVSTQAMVLGRSRAVVPSLRSAIAGLNLLGNGLLSAERMEAVKTGRMRAEAPPLSVRAPIRIMAKSLPFPTEKPDQRLIGFVDRVR